MLTAEDIVPATSHSSANNKEVVKNCNLVYDVIVILYLLAHLLTFSFSFIFVFSAKRLLSEAS